MAIDFPTNFRDEYSQMQDYDDREEAEKDEPSLDSEELYDWPSEEGRYEAVASTHDQLVFTATYMVGPPGSLH